MTSLKLNKKQFTSNEGLPDEKSFSKNNLYLVAVSGGPDSMFCLEKMRSGCYKIVVAHVNYQKREESGYDEGLVRDYCQKYSLPLEIRRVEKDEYMLSVNFQDWARQLRYNFFQEVAQKYQTRYIVIAHHQDDHCETYLLQKNRKSLVDYWGLPLTTQRGKFKILRPLLSLNKRQIIDYLTEKNIAYALDVTNQLPIYQRNILRLQVENLSSLEKDNLLREIQAKNYELKKIKSLVSEQKKKFILSNSTFYINRADNYSPEIYLRLLYSWIDQVAENLLYHRKKKLLIEVYKQLFISKKNSLVIKLGGDWQIVKNGLTAIVQNS